MTALGKLFRTTAFKLSLVYLVVFAILAGVVYVVAWEAFLATTHYPFMENYTAAMIQTQRAYELNSKAIQTSDQMLQKLGQL